MRRERLAILKDQLEVARAMMTDDRATYEGKHHSVTNAINKPAPIQQPWIPIMVGGNGPNVTWRLAAKYADELNVDGMTPDEVREALPIIRQRCEEIGRDPDSLKLSCPHLVGVARRAHGPAASGHGRCLPRAWRVAPDRHGPRLRRKQRSARSVGRGLPRRRRQARRFGRDRFVRTPRIEA